MHNEKGNGYNKEYSIFYLILQVVFFIQDFDRIIIIQVGE